MPFQKTKFSKGYWEGVGEWPGENLPVFDLQGLESLSLSQWNISTWICLYGGQIAAVDIKPNIVKAILTNILLCVSFNSLLSPLLAEYDSNLKAYQEQVFFLKVIFPDNVLYRSEAKSSYKWSLQSVIYPRERKLFLFLLKKCSDQTWESDSVCLSIFLTSFKLKSGQKFVSLLIIQHKTPSIQNLKSWKCLLHRINKCIQLFRQRLSRQLKSLKVYVTIPKGMMGCGCSLLHRQVHEFSAQWKVVLWILVCMC